MRRLETPHVTLDRPKSRQGDRASSSDNQGTSEEITPQDYQNAISGMKADDASSKMLEKESKTVIGFIRASVKREDIKEQANILYNKLCHELSYTRALRDIHFTPIAYDTN